MASEFEIAVMQALGKIQGDTGATQTGLIDLRRDLLDPGGRVPKIEAAMDKQDTRHWIAVSIIAPVTIMLHALLRRFGIQI